MIGELCEHDQAVEVVIAIGALAQDPQRQVDLGEGRFAEVGGHCGRPTAQPPLSDFLTLSA
jgi:hypothetical protein